MYCYNYVKAINADKLDVELKHSSLPYVYLETVGDKVKLWMRVDLTSEQVSSLDSIMESHTTLEMVDPGAIVRDKIVKAMEFGRNFIVSYAADNIMAGYSLADIQKILERTTTITTALTTGSLYVALDELNKLQPDELITEATITKYRHKLQDYLNLPRT